MHTIYVTIIIDSNGDFAVAREADDARELYEDEYGNFEDTRSINMELRVNLPQPIEITKTLDLQENDETKIVRVLS